MADARSLEQNIEVSSLGAGNEARVLEESLEVGHGPGNESRVLEHYVELVTPKPGPLEAWVYEANVEVVSENIQPLVDPRPMYLPDISAAVQEVVNQPGWVSGNALSIIGVDAQTQSWRCTLVSWDA